MTRNDGSYNITTGTYKGVQLEAPADFWENFDEVRFREMGYGGGPGGIGDWLVPDTFWGLNMWICFAIHDHMYRATYACTRQDKDISDQLLLENSMKYICAKSWPVLRWLRMYRATTYFNAVQGGGDSSFWCDGKKGDPQQ